MRLFAAVAAMGIPWKKTMGQDGGERVWTFAENSDCLRWNIKDLTKWWRNRDFYKADPAHPFHVVKCAMASHKGLKDAIKNQSSIMQRQVGMSRIVEASDGVPVCAIGHKTVSVPFAAAASAVGFEVFKSGERDGRMEFAIGLSSGHPYTVQEIVSWWRDEGFERHNNQHPFAYAKAVMITYENAINEIRQTRGLVKWQPKGAVGTTWIHPNCSAETEAKASQWMKR